MSRQSSSLSQGTFVVEANPKTHPTQTSENRALDRLLNRMMRPVWFRGLHYVHSRALSSPHVLKRNNLVTYMVASGTVRLILSNITFLPLPRPAAKVRFLIITASNCANRLLPALWMSRLCSCADNFNRLSIYLRCSGGANILRSLQSLVKGLRLTHFAEIETFLAVAVWCILVRCSRVKQALETQVNFLPLSFFQVTWGRGCELKLLFVSKLTSGKEELSLSVTSLQINRLYSQTDWLKSVAGPLQSWSHLCADPVDCS